MNSVENLIGGSNADALVGDGTANRVAGGAGADALRRAKLAAEKPT
jgi:Ca2+-binding RTX toxin-like protein